MDEYERVEQPPFWQAIVWKRSANRITDKTKSMSNPKWGQSKKISHQKKTCEMITPHGVIRQFPANGRLITPTMSWSHHLSFDHTVKFLITPLNVWSHRHIFDHTLKFFITPYTFCSHRSDFIHTIKFFVHTIYFLWSHRHNFVHTLKIFITLLKF